MACREPRNLISRTPQDNVASVRGMYITKHTGHCCLAKAERLPTLCSWSNPSCHISVFQMSVGEGWNEYRRTNWLPASNNQPFLPHQWRYSLPSMLANDAASKGKHHVVSVNGGVLWVTPQWDTIIVEEDILFTSFQDYQESSTNLFMF